jgi:hypothetical protein
MISKSMIFALLASVSSLGYADQHKKDEAAKKPKRKAHAHEHGKSEFKIIASGKDLSLEGALPMDDIIGFERAPANEAEKEALKAAMDLIKTGKLIAPENADCTISEAKAFVDPAFDQKITHYEVDIDLSWKCQSPVTHLKLDGFANFKNVNSLKLVALNQGKQTSISVKRSDQKTVVPLAGK